MLFLLLRSAVSGKSVSGEEKALYYAGDLPQLAMAAKMHDVIHLLALGLQNSGLFDAESKSLKSEIFTAVYRYEQLNHELKVLCDALEQAGIAFIPLKGSVIRKYYPEPWMRTSCDMDVLVHEEDLKKAISVLADKYGYVYHGKGTHDVSLFSPHKVHIELHYDLIEDNRVNSALSSVLSNVWRTAKPHGTCTYWHEMSDEMFYFYHIVHMAKHFENGGCGIRPFLDLWILDGIDGADVFKRNQLLEQGKLLTFANSARRLSKIWFGGEPYDDISRQMEEYILRGGVYGTKENRVIIQQQKEGGRLKYMLAKVFLRYDEIKYHYPILMKHKWLTPIMEVRRWGKHIFCDHGRQALSELKYSHDIPKDTAAGLKSLLQNIGL